MRLQSQVKHTWFENCNRLRPFGSRPFSVLCVVFAAFCFFSQSRDYGFHRNMCFVFLSERVGNLKLNVIGIDADNFKLLLVLG